LGYGAILEVEETRFSKVSLSTMGSAWREANRQRWRMFERA
jgi:hypothetical protein